MPKATQLLVSPVVPAGGELRLMTTVFSLIYISRLSNLAPGMVWPALAVIALQFSVSILPVLSRREAFRRYIGSSSAR